MDKTEIRDTWEVMAFLQKARGAEIIAGILDVSTTQVRRYSRNPKMRYSDPSAPNPLDRAIDILDELNDVGREDLLLSALNMMAVRYGLFCSKDVPAIPDKTDIALELLDDLPKKVDFYKSILNNDPPEIVRYFMGELIDEIRQDYALYLEKRGEKR